MRSLLYISLIMITLAGCEEDRMDNYRNDFGGNFSFNTIIHDEKGIIDTIDFAGSIEPVYSNLINIIYIHFLPEFTIDPVLNQNGQLFGNDWWLGQSVPISVSGSFHNNKQDIGLSLKLINRCLVINH